MATKVGKSFLSKQKEIKSRSSGNSKLHREVHDNIIESPEFSSVLFHLILQSLNISRVLFQGSLMSFYSIVELMRYKEARKHLGDLLELVDG